MGAIKDRSLVTLQNCLSHSRANEVLSTGELNLGEEYDTFVLDIMLDGIKEQADHFCANEFIKEDECGDPVLDGEGKAQELPIPAAVELWILRKFSRVYEHRIAGNNEVNFVDIGSIKLDDRDHVELTPAKKFFRTAKYKEAVK